MKSKVIIQFRARKSRNYASYAFIGTDAEINRELARWHRMGYCINVIYPND